MKRYQRVHGAVRAYDVFARRTRPEALRMVGTVVAPDPDRACVYARATYDEERWVEMRIVPSDEMITVWGPGEEQ